jgi:uncharacterized membrane protein YkoI
MKPRRFAPFRRPLLIAAIAGVCGVLAAATAPVLADDDAERAREQVEAGRYVPLEDIIRAARERYPGRVVEVELDDDDDEYEIEILQDDGTKVELEYDALTGKLLEVDVDDD